MADSTAAWKLTLVPPNAEVRIETKAIARDSAGGVTETWSSVVTRVKALISLAAAGRPGQWEAVPNVRRGTLTGFDDALARADVRLVVTSGFLAGKTLAVDDVAQHPAGQLVPARTTIHWHYTQPAT